MLKTKSITQPQLDEVQLQINEKKHQIIVMQKKIELYLRMRDRKFTPEDQAKYQQLLLVRKRMRDYRKAINQSSKSPRTVYQFTIDKFEKTQNTIADLEEQILKAQQTMFRLQNQAKTARLILEKINIPHFKDELLKLDFNSCVTINAKVLRAIRSMDFCRDEITQNEKKVVFLKKEIERLKPPKPSMCLIKPSANKGNNRVSAPPQAEMTGCTSYEDRRMKSAMKKLAPVLKDAAETRPNKINVVFKDIDQKMKTGNITLSQIQKRTKSVHSQKDARKLKAIDVFALVKDKAHQINEIKKRIMQNQADLIAIETDIPQIKLESPEGLLKWRDQLIKQQKAMKAEYEMKINKAKAQLKDAKLILNRRLSGLQKLSPVKE